MHRLLCVAFAALLVVPLLALAGNDASKELAQRNKSSAAKEITSAKPPRVKSASPKPIPVITAEQEAAALNLVRQHHSDLLELLIYLKESVPHEYQRAIRDLSRASERLTQFKKRDPRRYQIELELWQAQSRRQLITARLQMGHDESLLKELRETLTAEHRLALAVLRHERERLAGRIAKIDEQIKTQEDGAKSLVERKFATLTKAAKTPKLKASSKDRKPATRTKTKDPT